MIKFFEWLWLRGIKNWWSKLRWWKASKEKSYEVPKFDGLYAGMSEVSKLDRGYKWEMDGIDDLFDTYMPAPYIYNRMMDYINGKGERIRCDCDDVHGAILNLFEHNGYDVALITLATIPITESHTMTAIREVNDEGVVKFYVVNYTSLRGAYTNLEDFVNNYGTPVRYWCLQKYDYKKGKYYNIDKSWGVGNTVV